MPKFHTPVPDENLTPHFHWRWNEHGIYLGVCSIIGAFVLILHLLPAPPKRHFNPALVEVIHVHYIASADEPPEREDPFHDPRVIPLRRQIARRLSPPAM